MSTRPPLPKPAHFTRVGDAEYRDCWNAQQVAAYADTVLREARDCRTCYNMRRNETCDAFKPCTDADRYEPLPPVRLWRTEK